MTTVSTQHHKIPEFVCKTPSSTLVKITAKIDPYQSLSAIYVLRLAIGLKNKLPLEALGALFYENKLVRLTGLATDSDVSLADLDINIDDSYQKITAQLDQVLQAGMALDSPLFSNVKRLAKEFKLSACEQELLVFSLLMGHNRQFKVFISDYCTSNTETSIRDYLQLMTARAGHEIEDSLQPSSALCCAGWLDAEEDSDLSCFKRAILLLDEADRFLSERQASRYNWEASSVNELLTQMETFDGIFICTTNLMARIDKAALRRFDFKVQFDYLTAEQRWNLFAQEGQRLGVPLPEDKTMLTALKQQMQRLTQLTPGDFAVLNRQAKFQEQPFELTQMLTILEQECVAKGEQFSCMGFVN